MPGEVKREKEKRKGIFLKRALQKLTTGLFWILRARFAYFRVLRVSSAFISAGLIQAGEKK